MRNEIDSYPAIKFANRLDRGVYISDNNNIDPPWRSVVDVRLRFLSIYIGSIPHLE